MKKVAIHSTEWEGKMKENEEIKNDMKSEEIIVMKKLFERQQNDFNCFCALNLSWFVADMEFSFNNIY